MSETRELVIVGGGPAGIATALHLLDAAPRLAERIVVLEKERYPREKICAGAIGARAFRVLEEIGVGVDVPRVELEAVALRLGGRMITVPEPGLGVVVRRLEFDHALARQAMARGIEVRDGCGVSGLEVGDDGVRLTLESGETLSARAVVGADGVGGVVRRQLGFPRGALRAQVVELDTEGVAGDPPRDTILFDFDARDLNGYAWDFPTLVDGAPLMCRGVYLIKNGEADEPKARLDDYLAAKGLDLRRYRLKPFAERGFEPGEPISRPRVLLVGEAAGIDIATGEGIAQAIEYGALAGPYLARAFARNDLRFSDWRLHVDRHHVGWQLRIRHACFRLFYGHRRPTVERVLPRLEHLLRVGTQDFAGKPLSKLAIVKGAAQLFAALARAGMRRDER